MNPSLLLCFLLSCVLRLSFHDISPACFIVPSKKTAQIDSLSQAEHSLAFYTHTLTYRTFGGFSFVTQLPLRLFLPNFTRTLLFTSSLEYPTTGLPGIIDITMPACLDFRRMRTRVQTVFRRREKKRTYEISAPFNFKKECTILPGITQDEISVLREKAAASCLGIRHDYYHEPNNLNSMRSLHMPPHAPIMHTRSSSSPLLLRPQPSSISTASGSLW